MLQVSPPFRDTLATPQISPVPDKPPVTMILEGFIGLIAMLDSPPGPILVMFTTGVFVVLGEDTGIAALETMTVDGETGVPRAREIISNITAIANSVS